MSSNNSNKSNNSNSDTKVGLFDSPGTGWYNDLVGASPQPPPWFLTGCISQNRRETTLASDTAWADETYMPLKWLLHAVVLVVTRAAALVDSRAKGRGKRESELRVGGNGVMKRVHGMRTTPFTYSTHPEKERCLLHGIWREWQVRSHGGVRSWSTIKFFMECHEVSRGENQAWTIAIDLHGAKGRVSFWSATKVHSTLMGRS